MRKISYGADPGQYYLRPTHKRESRTAIAFVHGGFWRREKSPEDHAWQVEYVFECQHDAFAIGYRTTDQGAIWPTCVEDVESAVSQARSELGFSRLLLVGHSAGGHLSLKVQDRARSGVDVLALAPISDLKVAQMQGLGRGAVGEMTGGSEELRDDASVNDWSDGSKGYRGIVHGSADQTVPLSMSTDYWVRNQGHLDFHVLAGASHMDLVKNGRKAARAVLSLAVSVADSLDYGPNARSTS